MPIILEINYADNSKETLKIPAEIWRRNAKSVAKLIITEKEIREVVVDPNLETADVDLSNNAFPPRIAQSRIEAFKSESAGDLPDRDLMQDIKSKLERGDESDR